MPQRDAQIVPYNHPQHFEQLRFICRDVYGGHDYLPNQALRYSRDSEKAVLALESAAAALLLGIGELASHARSMCKTNGQGLLSLSVV